ncbi:MAG: hypothetical protein ACREN5_06045 [Gemmatimonadales bacterium]
MRTPLLLASALLALPVSGFSLHAQGVVRPPALPAPNRANPADVTSIDAIVKALYETVGFPPGGDQDSTRMRTLFAPGAHLIPPQSPQRPDSFLVWTVDEYLRVIRAAMQVNPNLKSRGFSEREVARRTERFGNLVHLFSTYESRYTAQDSVPFARGINSIQVMFHNNRWWVLNIAWDAERPGNPLPPEYLRSPD